MCTCFKDVGCEDILHTTSELHKKLSEMDKRINHNLMEMKKVNDHCAILIDQNNRLNLLHEKTIKNTNSLIKYLETSSYSIIPDIDHEEKNNKKGE